MKNFKRFTAAVAATLMAASLSIPMTMNVSAATKDTISFTGEAGTGHQYFAYRIFGGEVKTTDNKTELTNIVWANPDKADDFLAALQKDVTIGSDFTNCTNAAEVAAVLGTYQNNSPKAKAFAKFVAANKDKVQIVNAISGSAISATDDGYYVIVETPLNGTPQDAAMTSYLLAVYDASEGAEIEVKSAIPTVIKKIKENSALPDTVGTTDNRMSDYNIPADYNDTADFSIGDTVPFQIVGSMPSNIDEYASYKYIFHDTLDSQFTLAENFGVSNVTITIGGEKVTTGYTVAVENNEITITFDNIKNVAELTADSKVVVDYSATLSNAAEIGQFGQKNAVYLEYSNNPNVSGEGETDTTSKTPKDEVIAFTYELDVTKIDGANEDLKLAGAKFKLQATDGEHINKWVQVDIDGKVSGWADTEADGSELTSGTDGIFKVIGLDQGNYSLKETEAPKGYNILADPVAFDITASIGHSQSDDTIDGQELSYLKLTVNGNQNVGIVGTGIVEMSIENNSGSTLPSTGGMGTKLFYLGGGAMVAVAGIVLITKKRMSKNAE